jgi:hypothetical protein
MMTKIMQPGPVAVRWAPQADLARQRHEGAPQGPVAQSRTLFGDEEAGSLGDGITAVALYHIVAKRLLGGGMQWQQTRFAELS